MIKPPTLRQAMTPFPYSIAADAQITGARRLMREHRIRHLPVKDGEELVGVVTDRRLRFLEGIAAESPEMDYAVRDAMDSEPYTVDIGEPIDNVLMSMAEQQIGSALITRRGQLAGIFTCVDACRCLAEHLRERFPRGGGDVA